MNILLLGSGGREHALAWKIAASPLLTKLWCAPGNAGIAREAVCVPLDIANHAAVIEFCKVNRIDFVVVGPEAPLAAGIVDDLAQAGIKAFGPSKAAAQLEGSKGFTKDLCKANNIPTAAYRRFTEAEAAKAYIRSKGAPIVVKADGLAAGKGVVVAMTLDEAEAAVDMMLSGGFGAAGAEAVVEEFLTGEEASFFVLCDGEHALPLATAQDHKRAFDGDKGPNTGGMGAYSPAPVMTDAIWTRAMNEIIQPTLRAMRANGTPYKGVLFAGLMITAEGPKLIEYNVRFGDPETQAILVRLKSDLAEIFQAISETRLGELEINWSNDSSACVVLAARGYPARPEIGSVIDGLSLVQESEDIAVFHAATSRGPNGDWLTAGGRVLGVTATGENLEVALSKCYRTVAGIHWSGMHYRRDIGRTADHGPAPAG